MLWCILTTFQITTKPKKSPCEAQGVYPPHIIAPPLNKGENMKRLLLLILLLIMIPAFPASGDEIILKNGTVITTILCRKHKPGFIKYVEFYKAAEMWFLVSKSDISSFRTSRYNEDLYYQYQKQFVVPPLDAMNAMYQGGGKDVERAYFAYGGQL